MSIDGRGTEWGAGNGVFEHEEFTGSFDPRCFVETCMFVPQLAVYSGEATDSTLADADASEADDALPLPTEMLNLFEQVTGWVVEFEETRSSYRRRQFEAKSASTSASATLANEKKQPHLNQTARGELSTQDMSAGWPAGRPTGHRAKCDQFLELLSGLVSQLQDTEAELTRAQSALAALDPPSFCDDDDAILVDSFVPQWEAGRDADRRVADRRSSSNASAPTASENDDDFELVDFNESVDLDALIQLSKIERP
jgi:hypothetical protein